MDAVAILQYLSIPVIAGVVGWGTNLVAIKMTFWPVEFVGIRPIFGWQGIIPKKSEKMARITVDNSLSKLASLTEIYQQVGPAEIAWHVCEVLEPRVEEYVDTIMLDTNRVVWENLPPLMKRRIYRRIRRDMPQLVEKAVRNFGEHVDDLVDLEDMVITEMGKDKRMVNMMFIEVGEPEFKFVIRSGFYFGVLFGLIQMAVWYLYPAAWLLPVFGFAVGWLTNWIALNLIFRPLEPRKIGPFTLHGLFLARQKQAAETFSKLTTDKFITVQNIAKATFTGPHSDLARLYLRKEVTEMIDNSGMLGVAVRVAVGPAGYAELKKNTTRHFFEGALRTFDDPSFKTARRDALQSLMRERMMDLSSAEFQDLLRPAFQEDEWQLILLGGVLGLGAGFLQLFLVFGGGAG
ncbi:MAG: hypothetical protein JJLCMIEE_00711 [Acidimicrobiales bacterium]|nr:hypothetical protein [Acidimicrobiales bacterium]